MSRWHFASATRSSAAICSLLQMTATKTATRLWHALTTPASAPFSPATLPHLRSPRSPGRRRATLFSCRITAAKTAGTAIFMSSSHHLSLSSAPGRTTVTAIPTRKPPTASPPAASHPSSLPKVAPSACMSNTTSSPTRPDHENSHRTHARWLFIMLLFAKVR